VTEREAAWDRVHDALARLPGWRAPQAQYHAEERRWHVTAYDGRPLGRGKPHEALEGTGATEAEALEELARRLENRAATS
jgi:hypothetical protein